MSSLICDSADFPTTLARWLHESCNNSNCEGHLVIALIIQKIVSQLVHFELISYAEAMESLSSDRTLPPLTVIGIMTCADLIRDQIGCVSHESLRPFTCH